MAFSEKQLTSIVDPIPLDPIILLARDELLEKYSDKSFENKLRSTKP